jgi:hypothetical protein
MIKALITPDQGRPGVQVQMNLGAESGGPKDGGLAPGFALRASPRQAQGPQGARRSMADGGWRTRIWHAKTPRREGRRRWLSHGRRQNGGAVAQPVPPHGAISGQRACPGCNDWFYATIRDSETSYSSSSRIPLSCFPKGWRWAGGSFVNNSSVRDIGGWDRICASCASSRPTRFEDRTRFAKKCGRRKI